MNLAEVTVADGAIALGGASIPLDPSRRPDLRDGERVVVGIRPEAFEDAAFAPAGLPQLDVQVDVVEELGSDAFVFFALDVQPVLVEEATPTADEDATLLAPEERALFGARVDPRTSARPGERFRIAVDPSRFHFFAPETGESLLRT
jgi:multiple sugar transport system ATP-binding protein